MPRDLSESPSQGSSAAAARSGPGPGRRRGSRVTGEAFIELRPAARMRRLEALRAKILRLLTVAPEAPTPRPDEPLSAKSMAWLRRLESALVDDTVSPQNFRELAETAAEAIAAEERPEVYRRLMQYSELAELIPLESRSVREALLPVVEAGIARHNS
jgi:hypothetical protein